MKPIYIYLSSLIFCLTGCLKDDYSLCTFDSIMNCRYMLRGIDRFDDHIYSIHYYLFDSEGIFVGVEKSSEEDMGQVALSGLASGEYTMIALANLDDYSITDHEAELGIKHFKYTIAEQFEARVYKETVPPIYWGTARFQFDNRHSKRYVIELSNIHCVLNIQVEWEGLPPYSDGYMIKLKNLTEAYDLNPDNATILGIQKFPKHMEEIGTVSFSPEIEDLKLKASIRSLRYKNNRIPQIEIWHEDKIILPEIELSEIFYEWGWQPDINPVQVYRISIKMLLDGHIEISSVIDSEINDWEDGGIIGK